MRKVPLEVLRIGSFPPKSWVPRRAKIPRKRNRRTRRDKMASIELVREIRRFRRVRQYLMVGRKIRLRKLGKWVGNREKERVRERLSIVTQTRGYELINI